MSAEMMKVLTMLKRHVHRFDLDDGRLGEDLMDAAAGCILADVQAQRSPDGSDWASLSPAYLAAKAKQYPGEGIGDRTGVMLSAEQIAGERSVTPLRASMKYGVSDVAREEALRFQLGDGDQPGRAFWGFSAESLARQKEILKRRMRGRS